MKQKDTPANGVELLELVRRDVGGLSDEDLERLALEMQLESSRRNKLLNASGSFLKSRWLASLALLGVAFFIIFKAETNGITDDGNNHKADKKVVVADKNLAAPGEHGAWMLGDTTTTKKTDSGQEKKETDSKPQIVDKELKQNQTDDAQTDGSAEATAASATTEKETKGEEQAKQGETTNTVEETNPPEPTIEGGGIEEPPSDDQRPRATINAKLAAKKSGTRPKIVYQYKPRSPLDTNPAKAGERDKIKAELASKWGSWTLVDPKAAERPKDDFARTFPDRDIPWDKFPDKAWQVDQSYLSKFLPEAKAHVERAIEAILAEYGWSKFDLPDLNLEERINGTEQEPHSFKTAVLNLTVEEAWVGKNMVDGDLGGWISKEYFDGLIRRLMHAIITGDTFTLVMGGHSAAAGHGNHFQQSYTLQFHKVMEPVFARLGVKLLSHNVAFGGLGTLQTSLGSGDLYGKEIDILVWDSSMTENSNEAYDFYVRQAVFAGNRVPVLMGGMPSVLVDLGKNINFPVGSFGVGTGGVPEIKDGNMAESVKWMARYLRCNGETHGLCRDREYNGTCWIDRDDYTPAKAQQKEPGGRASWHPGFRQHAIKGRIIAFQVLRALHEGLKLWDEAPDKKLPVDVWHVSDHYKSLRTKVQEIPKDKVPCFNWKELEPQEVLCTTAMNGASEMTPRAFPRDTSLRNIMKPALNGYKPEPEKPAYNPPDVFNPFMETPDGEFDYLAVVENGVQYAAFLAFDNSPIPLFAEKTGNKLIEIGKSEIKPGLGWGLSSPANPDGCDGSYDGFCSRQESNPCLLYGHHDNRGGLQMTSYSGWGVFTVPNVKHGVILMRVEWWYKGGDFGRTREWKEENNGDPAYTRHLLSNTTKAEHIHRLGEPRVGSEQSHRTLKGEELCNEGKFEVAVNGNIKTYTKDEFMKALKIMQRVVQVITVLDDRKLTNGESRDVEFAVRFSGCGLKNGIVISNVYWA